MFFSCTASTLMYGMSAGMLLSLLILKGPKWWKDRVQAKRDKEFKEFMRMVDDYRERSEILRIEGVDGREYFVDPSEVSGFCIVDERWHNDGDEAIIFSVSVSRRGSMTSSYRVKSEEYAQKVIAKLLGYFEVKEI